MVVEEDDRKPAAFDSARAPTEDNDENNDVEDADDEEDDDDDDEDNWSRQVETDEAHNTSFRTDVAIPTPVVEQLSLKEKLVLRERQGRLETERARLKRQFAQSAADHHHQQQLQEQQQQQQQNQNQQNIHNDPNHNDLILETRHHDVSAGNPSSSPLHAEQPPGDSIIPEQEQQMLPESSSDRNRPALETTSSHAGTLGEESTKAHPDPETQEAIGLTMERFLRNSEHFRPAAEDESSPPNDTVIMERFLNEPVVVVPAPSNHRDDDDDDIQSRAMLMRHEQHTRSVSFDVNEEEDVDDHHHHHRGGESHEDDTRTPGSMLNESSSTTSNARRRPHEDGEDDNSSSATDQPRVLRLTEADMRELEAIDEVSIGNAPPSERDDSIVGDLHEFAPQLSQGTPTTAMESASESGVAALTGNQHAAGSNSNHLPNAPLSVSLASSTPSALHSRDGETDHHHHRLDRHHHHHLDGGETDTVQANPPSVIHRDDSLLMDSQHDDGLGPPPQQDSSASLPVMVETPAHSDVVHTNDSINNSNGDDDDDDDDSDKGDEEIPNRRIRPGMVPAASVPFGDALPNESTEIEAPKTPVRVDDFDYDKTHHSERAADMDSFLESPAGKWSANVANNMAVSPIWTAKPMPGTAMETTPLLDDPLLHRTQSLPTRPTTLHDVPPEIITRQTNSNNNNNHDNSNNNHNRNSEVIPLTMRSAAECAAAERDAEHEDTIFDSIRQNDNPALPDDLDPLPDLDRLAALGMTIALQVPILMVWSSSTHVCQMIGRSRWQALLTLTPMIAASCGTMALQSSALTQRAIVRRKLNPNGMLPWVRKELWRAAGLGCLISLATGIAAFFVSLRDMGLVFPVMIGQLVGIVVGSGIGVGSPILFASCVGKSSQKWGSVLETGLADLFATGTVLLVSFACLSRSSVNGDSCAI